MKYQNLKKKNYTKYAEALQTMQDTLWVASHFQVLVDYTIFV